MTDPRYAWWYAALEGQMGAITEEAPQLGFYRKRAGKNGPWLPVAVWEEDGLLWVMVGKEAANASADRVRDTWLACAKYPVTDKEYRHALATAQWPGTAPAEEAGEGHNQPPEGFEDLAKSIAEQAAEAEAWLKDRKIESQAEADECEKRANDFSKLKRQAETEHKSEKEPHLVAGRGVDAKYKPLIARAEAMAKSLKVAATAFLVARQTERKQAAAQSIAAGDVAPARMDVRATTSGVSGRKLALRTVKKAEIEDWEKAIGFFSANPELRELVQRLADRCAQIDAPVPGVTFKSEQKAA